jgi:hypothetical protein
VRERVVRVKRIKDEMESCILDIILSFFLDQGRGYVVVVVGVRVE